MVGTELDGVFLASLVAVVVAAEAKMDGIFSALVAV